MESPYYLFDGIVGNASATRAKTLSRFIPNRS